MQSCQDFCFSLMKKKCFPVLYSDIRITFQVTWLKLTILVRHVCKGCLILFPARPWAPSRLHRQNCGVKPAVLFSNNIRHFAEVLMMPYEVHAFVTVFAVPPQVFPSPSGSVVLINEFDTAQLTCTFRAEPMPSVVWSVGGMPAHGVASVAVRDGHNLLYDATLTIMGANRTSALTFMCMASNGAGSGQDSVFLNVQGMYLHCHLCLSPVLCVWHFLCHLT